MMLILALFTPETPIWPGHLHLGLADSPWDSMGLCCGPRHGEKATGNARQGLDTLMMHADIALDGWQFRTA